MENIIHLHLFINDMPILDYYLDKYLNVINMSTLKCEEVIVNFTYIYKNNWTIHKAVLKEGTYYEINMENAYKELYCMPLNEYTSIERYFLQIMKMVLQESPKDLIEFLVKVKKIDKEYLLEIEKIFYEIKKKKKLENI